MKQCQDTIEFKTESVVERLLKSKVSLAVACVLGTIGVINFFNVPILGSKEDIAQLKFQVAELQKQDTLLAETLKINANTENNHWVHVQNWELWQVQVMTAIANKLNVPVLQIPKIE
jgi:hypothetical protein